MLLTVPISADPACFFRLETFSPCVGDKFNLLRGSEWVTVTLAEASPVGGHRPIECEKFSLVFAAGPEKPLQQGMHAFRHDVLGEFELFITPVKSPHPGLCWYESSVNRETAP